MKTFEWKHNPKYIFELANCLAYCKDVPWNKVNVIYNLCPQQNVDGIFVITSQGLDGIIALGNYFIKSGFQHGGKIVTYLMKLLSGLLSARWPEDSKQIVEVPFAEKFTACLNSLLSDISIKTKNDGIIIHQVKEVLRIIHVMQNEINGNCVCLDGIKHNCLVKYYIFVGLMQSFGRFSCDDKSYFCYMFPSHLQCVGIAQQIRRNYDDAVFIKYSSSKLTASDMHRTHCDLENFTKCDSGISFALMKNISDEIQYLLRENNLINLSKRVQEHQLHSEQFQRFPYANFNDVIKLTAIYFLNNILCHESSLPVRYVEEINIFMERFYVAEQDKLNSNNYSLDLAGNIKDMLRINLLTKVVSLEILVWSTDNQLLADLLSTHVEKRLCNVETSKNFIIIRAPYIVACLNAIGNIAENFPSTSPTCVNVLRDFLLQPSSLFTNLNLHSYPSDIFILKNLNTKSLHHDQAVFKMIQKCAVQNICVSLQAAQETNNNYIPAFVTSFSRHLFTEKTIPHHITIIENVVTTLGHISCSIPFYSDSIIHCFHLRLGRHSPESDIAIIKQLGNILLITNDQANFIVTYKLMNATLLKAIKSHTSEMKHLLETIFLVLFLVAEHLKEVQKVNELFMWLVDIFVQMSLDETKANLLFNKDDNNRAKNNILHIIALLANHLPEVHDMRQSHLFQDFFIYCIMVGNSSLESHEISLKKIAPKLPTLTSENVTDHDLREFYYISTLNMNKICQSTQIILKNQLLDFLTTSDDDITQVVSRLTFSELIYLHSVCALEVLRIENSKDSSLEPIFCYLTNTKLQKDKHNLWECLTKIAVVVFNRFCTVMASRNWNDDREKVLVKHAQFLLIHFNNTNLNVRLIADKFFSDLIAHFPHLLWAEDVLFCLIDILCVLTYSVQADLCNEITSVQVPNTSYSINFMESYKSRREICNDFTARSQEILTEAMKWAPALIKSHVQHYLLRGEKYSEEQSNNSLCEFRNHAWVTLYSKHNVLQVEMSEIMSSLIMRSRFSGEMCGTIEKYKNSLDELVITFSNSIKKACAESNIVDYENTLRKITAFSINQTQLQWEIKHILASSHTAIFTKEGVVVAVQCWEWLCSERPQFQLELLQEMFAAWKFTMSERLGLFMKECNENCLFEPCNHMTNNLSVCALPHQIWIKYISQIIETAKYSKQDCLELIIQFLHSTLPVAIGTSDGIMNKHVEMSTARFHLLLSALSLLQSNIRVPFLTKIVLRNRIYCTCLDYFCGLRTFPISSGNNLRTSICILINLWHAIYNDKKYFKRDTMKINELKELDECKSQSVSRLSLLNKLKQPEKYDSDKDIDFDPTSEYAGFYNDFINKRKLALLLLAEELEFLVVWYNPTNTAELSVPGNIKVVEWKSKFFASKKSLHEIAACAWNMSPILAVYLPVRLKRDDSILKEVIERVQKNPTAVYNIPHALEYFATPECLAMDSPRLMHILTWSTGSPIQALSLFSRKYPQHPITLQYGLRTLLTYSDSTLVFYIPQLVQCLLNDELGFATALVLKVAKKSQVFCHQLIWNMKANMYTDINKTQQTVYYQILNNLLVYIVDNMDAAAKIFYEREFEFVNQITEVSRRIPRNLKFPERKIACLKALRRIKLRPGCYIPSSLDSIVLDIDYNSGTPLQSKERTPFMADFLVCICGFDKVNELGVEVASDFIGGSYIVKNLGEQVWQSTIFKAGDDVRQDILALQIMKIFKNVFTDVGLDLFLFPYNVVAIDSGMGVIECIPNATSRDQLGKKTDASLYDYFIQTYGDETTVEFQKARRNFVKSMAAYCVLNFLLQVKDRHNGNIMLDTRGHIMHIDFGFLFESSPGGNIGFEPDFKLTEEMVMIMGGKIESETFQEFVKLCVKAYLAIRPYQDHIISVVTLMLDSGLPCFRGNTINRLRSRFSPYASDMEAAAYMISVIKNSALNFRTYTYDFIQYFQNSIQY